MAFTIGRYGLGTLHQLGLLMAGVYTTCLIFIFGVLGLVARLAGFSLWRFLRYIREEILIVLGTSTSESALPGLMA
jgi:aerobic C4-dicarboxylate transport protein